jgi:hypothetical protein
METRKAEDAIVCPHCDFADTGWHEYVDPTEMYAEFPLSCPECRKPFHVVMETTVVFKTEQLEGEPFDEETY